MSTRTKNYSNIAECSIDELQTMFPDEGCDEATSCFDCPLPQCRHDDPAWYQGELRRRFHEALVSSYRATSGPDAQERRRRVAQEHGVGVRTVQRAVERAEQRRQALV